MTILKEISFFDVHRSTRKVFFLNNDEIRDGVNWTILTGRNGSYKSTIFREIVQGIILDNLGHQSSLIFSNRSKSSQGSRRVIAISGTVSDRFPIKRENVKTTFFDQPDYIYFGQRINANLISQMEIIEHAAFHMLDPKISNRLSLPVFREIFKLLNLHPSINLKIAVAETSTRRRRTNNVSLYDTLKSVAIFPSKIGSGVIQFSSETAWFLLKNFRPETFDKLDKFLRGSIRKISVEISDGVISDVLDPDTIRLGLYTEHLRIKAVYVNGLKYGHHFSAFDLSSGEYHLWSTLLAAFFTIQEGDVILIDEPEASLHPQWQIDYMRLLSKISSIVNTGHILISTHSPLIISAAEAGTNIVDVSDKESIVSTVGQNFARTADDILVGNFGLTSSRNHDFIDLIQKAITLVEQGKEDSEEFTGLSRVLQLYRKNISDTDPIVDIIDALTKVEV